MFGVTPWYKPRSPSCFQTVVIQWRIPLYFGLSSNPSLTTKERNYTEKHFRKLKFSCVKVTTEVHTASKAGFMFICSLTDQLYFKSILLKVCKSWGLQLRKSRVKELKKNPNNPKKRKRTFKLCEMKVPINLTRLNKCTAVHFWWPAALNWSFLSLLLSTPAISLHISSDTCGVFDNTFL